MTVPSGILHRKNSESAGKELTKQIALFVIVGAAANKTNICAVIDRDSGLPILLYKTALAGIPDSFCNRVQYPVQGDFLPFIRTGCTIPEKLQN